MARAYANISVRRIGRETGREVYVHQTAGVDVSVQM
jgi:hypothetical protein